jgi:hypothetical protein
MRGGSAAGPFALKYRKCVQYSDDGAALFVVYGDFDDALANGVLGVSIRLGKIWGSVSSTAAS